MENNKQIKLAKKNPDKLHAGIHDVCIQIQPKKFRLPLIKRMGMAPHQKLIDLR
jgi:hypothetical protein